MTDRRLWKGTFKIGVRKSMADRPNDPEAVRERLAEIPTEDARTLTGRMFGDPNPADTRREE